MQAGALVTKVRRSAGRSSGGEAGEERILNRGSSARQHPEPASESARSAAPRLLSRTPVQKGAPQLLGGRGQSEPQHRAAAGDGGPRPGCTAGHLVRLRPA